MNDNQPLETAQKALQHYCTLVERIPQVIEVRTNTYGDNTIAWTVISNPPLDEKPRKDILEAQVDTLYRIAQPFLEIHIMNLQELPSQFQPPGKLVWSRESQSGQPNFPDDAQYGKTPMAICYDFDGTMAPGRMQDRQFIPSTIGMDVDEFWEEVNRNTVLQQADPILSYMFIMLEQARQAGITICQKDLAQTGPGITFFPGVTSWFKRVNTYADHRGVRLSHFVISSGNSEIIENTPIANEFERIYASRFLYDQQDRAVWPARIVDFINKPNYLYRINKGALDQQSLFVINDFIPEPERAIPFENMVYIGDGETDVPCFQTIMSQGGLSIAVHQPEGREDARRYLDEGRVAAAVEADYRPDSPLDQIIRCQIDLVAAQDRLRNATQANKKGTEIAQDH